MLVCGSLGRGLAPDFQRPPQHLRLHLFCVHFLFGCSHEERGWDFAQPAPSGPWLVRGEPVSCLSWHLARARHCAGVLEPTLTTQLQAGSVLSPTAQLREHASK